MQMNHKSLGVLGGYASRDHPAPIFPMSTAQKRAVVVCFAHGTADTETQE